MHPASTARTVPVRSDLLTGEVGDDMGDLVRLLRPTQGLAAAKVSSISPMDLVTSVRLGLSATALMHTLAGPYSASHDRVSASIGVS